MARVARVIHEHLRREEGGSWKAVEGYSGVYIYIYIYAPRVSGLMTETI